jgi:hypothetical protein
MNRVSAGRDEGILAGLALLLIVALLEFPWFDFSYTPVVPTHSIPGLARPIYPTTTAAATQSPNGWLGVLAVAVTLVMLLELGLRWLRPGLGLPRITQSRDTTRLVLASLVLALLGLKFVSHIDFTGYQSFAWGFYADVAVVAALLAVAVNARRMTSTPAASDNPGTDGFQPSKAPAR